MINKFYLNFLSVLILLAAVVGSVSLASEKKAVAEKALSPAEVDAAFDKVFKVQQKIERMQAKVITEKVGGIFKKSKANDAYVFAQMPDKLLFIDKGDIGSNTSEKQQAIILIDGVFLWDIKPADESGVREAEQIDMKSAGNKDVNIAAILIGADVASGKQLRDYYDIDGKLETFDDGSVSYHFILKTIEGREIKKRKEIVDMWIEVGGAIPWKIKNIRMVPKVNPLNPNAPAKMKKTTSIKYITDLETNISKKPLKPFSKSLFFFGRILKENPGMKVLDSKGLQIDKNELQKDLNAVSKRL